MIARLLIIIASLAMAFPAAAQVVQLRSGEHETFSRLIIELPSRLNWKIEPGSKAAIVKFEAADLQVDTSVVFDKIPRDRVSDVTWNNTSKTLQLGLGCDCEVNGFWHGASLLVLDVQQRTARSTPAEPEPEPAMAKPKPSIDVQTQPLAQAAALTTMDLPGPRVPDPVEPAAVPMPSSQTAPMDDARDRLLQQFARAASQGLLEPRNSLPVPSAAPKATAELPEQQQPDIDTDNRRQINLKAESSIDRDFFISQLTTDGDESTNGCLPPHQVDVASWGNDAPFGQQVSALRMNLTGEFDAVSPDVALNLARLYLYFGFGAEARDTVELVVPGTGDTGILLQLADIAENGHGKDAYYLANQMDCTSSASLWSALSYEVLPPGLPIDTDAILRAFNALPQHLRTLYGPTLSRRFLDGGQPDIARKLLRILDRPNTPSTPDAEMAKAQVDKDAGQTQEADARLEKVVASNAEPSAEALVEMINDRIARKERVSFDKAQLAGSYAFEKQNEPIGAELSAAHIRALAASGAFDMAYETLMDRGTALRPDQIPGLHSDMIALLAQHASDMTFLQHILAQPVDPGSPLDPFAANQAARRLIDLGFPEPATKFIAKDAPRSSSAFSDRKRLRAEAALALNRPRQALVELLELDGTETNMLRARAQSAVGNHAAAYYLFASSQYPDKARQEAWLKGDWPNATDPSEPAYTALADMMAANDPAEGATPPTNQAVLARNRDLIDTSSAVRSTLSALLVANPLPVGTDSNP